MRASGVFTGTTNSPSRSPRQSIYHSTIRAGRNLPDKEFRSVSPTLFPEKPDFIFRVLCSLLKLFPVFLQCMFFKEGNNPFGEVIQPPDSVSHSIPVILPDHSATEESLQCV